MGSLKFQGLGIRLTQLGFLRSSHPRPLEAQRSYLEPNKAPTGPGNRGLFVNTRNVMTIMTALFPCLSIITSNASHHSSHLTPHCSLLTAGKNTLWTRSHRSLLLLHGFPAIFTFDSARYGRFFVRHFNVEEGPNCFRFNVECVLWIKSGFLNCLRQRLSFSTPSIHELWIIP